MPNSDTTVSQSRLFGEAHGDYFNDLDSAAGWPSKQQLRKISEIYIRADHLVDNITVTYDITGAADTTTCEHGGSGGREKYIRLADHEYLVGVSGQFGRLRKDWGPTNIHKLQLLILDKKTGNIRVEGPFGDGKQEQQTPFHVFGEIIGFAGYTQKAAQDDKKFLQSLSVFTI